MITTELLTAVRTACRVTTTAFDDELSDLALAALADLGITDIDPALLTDSGTTPLIKRAIVTYVRMHFGEPDDYERLKASYDEQKAQLLMSSTYNGSAD